MISVEEQGRWIAEISKKRKEKRSELMEVETTGIATKERKAFRMGWAKKKIYFVIKILSRS